MRFTCMFVSSAVALLISGPAWAQGSKPPPKPEEAPGWKPLDVEPDTPDPEPTQPKPVPVDESPYRPGPPRPRPPPRDPGPEPDGPEAESAGNRESSTLPESILWMKEWKPRFLTRHVRAEFDIWAADSATVYGWDVALSLGVDDVPVLLDIVVPWTHIDFDGTPPAGSGLPGGHTHIGNPTFGFHGGGVAANVIGFWGGAWVSVPTVDEFVSLDSTALLAGYMLRNGAEGHRFFPNVIPVRWAFGIEGQVFPLVYLRSDIYSTAYIPNEDLSGPVNVAATLEHIHEAEVLSPIGLGGGLRFQSVFNVSNFQSDALHALEPFISYQPPYAGPYAFGLFARVGLLLGLSDATSTQFLGSVATVRTQVGYRF